MPVASALTVTPTWGARRLAATDATCSAMPMVASGTVTRAKVPSGATTAGEAWPPSAWAPRAPDRAEMAWRSAALNRPPGRRNTTMAGVDRAAGSSAWSRLPCSAWAEAGRSTATPTTTQAVRRPDTHRSTRRRVSTHILLK